MMRPVRGLVSAGGAASAPPTASAPDHGRTNNSKRLSTRQRIGVSWREIVSGWCVRQEIYRKRPGLHNPTSRSRLHRVYQWADVTVSWPAFWGTLGMRFPSIVAVASAFCIIPGPFPSTSPAAEMPADGYAVGVAQTDITPSYPVR